MISDRQVQDDTVPKHDLTALHHDKTSRLLVALGHGHLGAHQSVRFSQTLQVPTSQSLTQRKSLFESPIDRFTRPLPVEKGLQKRQSGNVILASASNVSADKDNGQTYPSLSHALPEWYEAQNPHCSACCVPLLIGINANFDPVRRGLVCAACGSGSPMGMPDTESKKGLRSMRVRKNIRKKVEGKNTALLGQVSKKARIESGVSQETDVGEDKTLSSQQKIHKSEQFVKAKDVEVNQSNTVSLDARMKQKKKDKKGSQSASMDIEQSIPHPEKLNRKSQPEQQAPEIRTPSKETKIPNKVSTQIRQPSSASKPLDMKAKGNDKQALRNMLAANKKKKDDAGKASGSKAKSSNSSGLQSFLDSL
jgi:hypothetical protein